MLVRVASLCQSLQRWWLYASFSLLTIGIVTLGQPQLVRAAEWMQILIQGVQIIQLSNISDSQEASLGAETNRAILRQVRLLENLAVTGYVDRIGQRLVRSSGRSNIKYTFQVVEDNAINAFATMGGYVYINTGTMKAADNEAQLAGVIGHEIGHIAGKHSLQRVRQSAIAQGISTVAGVDRDRIVQMGVQLALTLPNSRNDEFDADRRGLAMLMQTGYAPNGLPDFMKKLVTSNSAPAFLSSHPAASDRVTKLQTMIPATSRNRTEGLNASAYKQTLRNFF